MSKQNLKAEIDQNINANGIQQITGSKLNRVLNDIVDEVALEGDVILKTEKGAPLGVATLDDNGNVVQVGDMSDYLKKTEANDLYLGKTATAESAKGSGKVEQGNELAVSGNEVYNYLNLSSSNISINGDFSSGLNSWTFGASITTKSVDAGVLKFKGAGGVSSASTRISQTSLPTTDDVVFIRAVARVTSAINASAYIQLGRGGATIGTQFMLTSEFKPYYTTSNTASNILKFSGGINSDIEVKNIVAYNLTAIFGAGKEPSGEVFEGLLNSGLEYVPNKTIDIRKLAIESTDKADLGYLAGETPRTLRDVEYLTNLTLTNVNTNGDFINATSGWTVGANIRNYSYSTGRMSYEGAGYPIDSATSVYKVIGTIPNEHKILISITAKSTNNATLLFGRGVNEPIQSEKLTTEYKRFSGVFDTASTRIKVGANIGGKVDISSITVMDLTAIFGAGKEPSAEYLTQILNITGYIAVSRVINNFDLRASTQLEISNLQSSVKPKLKVLLIGSSHGMDTIMSFPALAYYGGVDIVCGNLYSGGNDIIDVANKIRTNTDFAQLSLHFGNTSWIKQNEGVTGGRTVEVAITMYDWDIIILQRGAFQSNTWTTEQKEAMFYVIDYINSKTLNNPEIMFNSGFSLPINTSTNYTRQDQIDRSILINATAKLAEKDLFFEVIPTNTAVQNARNTILKNYGTRVDKDIARDETHLDAGIGTYVTGCVMFEKIIKPRFNISIRNMNLIPSRARVNGLINTVPAFTVVTEDMARVAKLCAISAVKTPYEFSETLPINFP